MCCYSPELHKKNIQAAKTWSPPAENLLCIYREVQVCTYVCMYVYLHTHTHTHTYIEKPKSYPRKYLQLHTAQGGLKAAMEYPFLNSAAWRAVWRVKLHIPLAFYRETICIFFKTPYYVFETFSYQYIDIYLILVFFFIMVKYA